MPRRGEGGVELVRVAHIDKPLAGMVMAHHGKVLIAAAGDAVFLLDVGRLESGKGDAVTASFSDGNETGSIRVNVTAYDKLLFVSEERAQTITVVDLERVRLKGDGEGAVTGKIRLGTRRSHSYLHRTAAGCTRPAKARGPTGHGLPHAPRKAGIAPISKGPRARWWWWT